MNLPLVPGHNILGKKSDSRFRGRDLFKQYGTRREIFAEMASPLVEDGIKFSIVLNGFKLIYTPCISSMNCSN